MDDVDSGMSGHIYLYASEIRRRLLLLSQCSKLVKQALVGMRKIRVRFVSISPNLGEPLHHGPGKCLLSLSGQTNQKEEPSYHTDSVCTCAIACQIGSHASTYITVRRKLQTLLTTEYYTMWSVSYGRHLVSQVIVTNDLTRSLRCIPLADNQRAVLSCATVVVM